jgi:hypothetical protein
MFPGSFEVLINLGIINRSTTVAAVHLAMRNVPVLYLVLCSGFLVSLGLAWLWWTLKYNYLWLVGRIFLYVSAN